MKHTPEESEADTRVYTSTTLAPDVRTAFARLYRAWKARGQPKSDFLAFVSAAGYDIPLRTLDEWVANVRAQGAATRLAKASGRPQALSQNTVRLIVGFVLDRNEFNVAVHLDTVQAFVRDRLGLDISLRSLSHYLQARASLLSKCKLISGRFWATLRHYAVVPILTMKVCGVEAQGLHRLVGDFDAGWIGALIQPF